MAISVWWGGGELWDARRLGGEWLEQGGELVQDEQGGGLWERCLWVVECPLVYVQHVEEEGEVGWRGWVAAPGVSEVWYEGSRVRTD